MWAPSHNVTNSPSGHSTDAHSVLSKVWSKVWTPMKSIQCCTPTYRMNCTLVRDRLAEALWKPIFTERPAKLASLNDERVTNQVAFSLSKFETQNVYNESSSLWAIYFCPETISMAFSWVGLSELCVRWLAEICWGNCSSDKLYDERNSGKWSELLWWKFEIKTANYLALCLPKLTTNRATRKLKTESKSSIHLGCIQFSSNNRK